MSRRRWIPFLVLFVAAGCSREGDGGGKKRDLVGVATTAVPAPSAPADDAAWRAVHERTFVVDLIQDLVFRKRRDGWSLTDDGAHTALSRQATGGVDLLFAALPGDASPDPDRALEEDLRDVKALVADAAGKARLVRNLAAAREARGSGAMPIMLLLEGADAVAEADAEAALSRLQGEGIAAVGLVTDRGNALADSAANPGDPGGLSARGAAFVHACREHGVIVDLTHASRNAFWDAIAGQNALVAVTHTAARALRDHPRNLDDLQIIALARFGGILGLVFNPDFVKQGDPSGASIDDLVAHARRVKRLGALSALALGTDFGGIIPPKGMDDVSALPALTAKLGGEGWTSEEIEGFLGANAVRFIEAVEAGQGAAESTTRTPRRPIGVECDAVKGEFRGELASACDGYVVDGGPRLGQASEQRFRLKEMKYAPALLEIFGEPGTPWQVEGQDLGGRVLLRRIVALDRDGRGEMSLPTNRNLTRLFLSPTRESTLFEAVVWGN